MFDDCIVEDALVETAPCFGSSGECGGWDEIDVVVVDAISKGKVVVVAAVGGGSGISRIVDDDNVTTDDNSTISTLFHLVTSSSLVADVDVAISLPTVHRRQLFNSTVMSITVDKCKYEDHCA